MKKTIAVCTLLSFTLAVLNAGEKPASREFFQDIQTVRQWLAGGDLYSPTAWQPLRRLQKEVESHVGTSLLRLPDAKASLSRVTTAADLEAAVGGLEQAAAKGDWRTAGINLIAVQFGPYKLQSAKPPAERYATALAAANKAGASSADVRRAARLAIDAGRYQEALDLLRRERENPPAGLDVLKADLTMQVAQLEGIALVRLGDRRGALARLEETRQLANASNMKAHRPLPSFLLAAELARQPRDEETTAAILRYIDTVKQGNWTGQDQLDTWASAIKAGGPVDFGLYGKIEL